MKPPSEPVDGPATMERLDGVLRKVLSVSHDEILRREAEYKRQADVTHKKRGPKPGVLNHKPRAPKQHSA